jgi:type IV pilus assembly protein PilX
MPMVLLKKVLAKALTYAMDRWVMNMKRNQSLLLFKKNQGMTLIISLILLLMVSLIGMSVLNVSTVEEKMAGGTRDKDLAFQAAEIALRRAEEFIRTSVSGTAGFTTNCNAGLCAELPLNSTVMRWEDDTLCSANTKIWNCDKSKEVDLTQISVGSFSQNPRYFIELLKDIDYTDSPQVNNQGDQAPEDKVQVYRITAIGYGGSTNSSVLLQSTYGKKI